MYVVKVDYQLREMQCGTCGIWHAIPETMYQSCLTEGGFWHCPAGHQRGFSKGGDKKRIEQLEKQLRDEQTRHAAALARANTAAWRDKATKALKRHTTRTKNGVCPCCNRTFKQLAAHMKNKHPDYGS
jgi:hypothetical protein